MKIDILDTEEHKKLRVEFNKETGILALLDNDSYISWLEQKVVENNCDLPVFSQLSGQLAIKGFDEIIKADVNGTAAKIARAYKKSIANCG